MTPWTVAHQTPLSMGFLRQEKRSGLPFPPGDFPHPWIEPASPVSPALQADSLPTEPSFWVQFCSVAQSCPTLCDPMDRSMPGLLVHHQLPDFTQTHAHWIGDAIQPSYPLLSPSSPTFNLSQHQGLFKWVSSSHQVALISEFQLQHQSFQWIFRADLL